MNSEANITVIYNGNIVTESSGIIHGGTIAWHNGRIVFIGAKGEEPDYKLAEDAAIIAVDANGGWVVPGFIDVHVHGGAGHDFMDATSRAYDAITRFHTEQGTTAMLATTVTEQREALASVIQATQEYARTEQRYAELLGVHLEGPFISPLWAGAQNPAHIITPQLEWLQDWVDSFPGLIRMLTLAPELKDAKALIAWLDEQGIVPACGHTDATYDCINEAVGHGLRHAVHSFNAMRGLHHREPGTVGAVMDNAKLSAEIIADGQHVHPACIRMLARQKPDDQVILVTDAIAAAGLGDGNYRSAGLDIVIRDNVSRLKDGGQLAGSVLTMIRGFQYLINVVGLPIVTASRWASGNPARLLGVDQERGSLERGKLADVLLLSADLELQQVWVKGRQPFLCEQASNPESGFLSLLANPARRALEHEGITTLELLAGFTEREILQLHGMGPKSMPVLRQALESQGLSFKSGT